MNLKITFDEDSLELAPLEGVKISAHNWQNCIICESHFFRPNGSKEKYCGYHRDMVTTTIGGFKEDKERISRKSKKSMIQKLLTSFSEEERKELFDID